MKPDREEVLLPDLVGGHRPEGLPAQPVPQPGAGPVLERLAPRHGGPGRGAVAEVVAVAEQVPLALRRISGFAASMRFRMAAGVSLTTTGR